VAQEYLRVCDEFGIVVGLAKSLVSDIGLINFANQTFLEVENISPLSLKEELKARSWSARLAIAKRALARWFPEDKSVISLLKRTLTVPMWNTYQGLTLRGKDYLGLGVVLTLIAQNPFIGASSDKPVGAEEIVSWVEGFLNPTDSSALIRTSFIEDLTVVFAREIFSLVNRRLPLLETYKEALWEVSVHSKRLILSGASPIDSYPHTGWSYIVEKLIYPLLDRQRDELAEIHEQASTTLGYHRNLLPTGTRIDRNHIHGPGHIYKVTGIFQDAEPDYDGIYRDFKVIVGLWLRSQALAAFGIGTVLSDARVIRDAARTGSFGTLLRGLLPTEHYRQEENLKLYGQVTDPNLVKLPIEQIQLTLLSHFGQHATLSPIDPVPSREITAQLPAKEKENQPVFDVTTQPVTDPISAAEAMYLVTKPVPATSKVQPIFSKDGSLERVIGGTAAERYKVMLNHSRDVRGLQPIRGEVSVTTMELGKPGFGDSKVYLGVNPRDEERPKDTPPVAKSLPVLRAGHDYEVPCAPSDVGYGIDPITGQKKVPAYLKDRQARLPGVGSPSLEPVTVSPDTKCTLTPGTTKPVESPKETLEEALARIDKMDNMDDKLAAILEYKRRPLS